ncbi:MAG: FtsK/SpoIIIE domain-containing protein, partial [Defluviitaleaceae bacterium]|nr:FtsK/SpoIIIE domain-containing protein [Defluviitaleaceae bacterium]
ISDEFAELKKEQPDFMTELTSTARVGRSLGVHLILATQKPGGVVDDQIRSNSRFRVCLKVQDNGDSMEMLGRSDAAMLVDTGRFYLQVGYNEIFEIGQSAWAGAPYYPSQRAIKDRDDAVSVINTNGRTIAENNTNRFAMITDPPKQLDVITKYVAKICDEEKIDHWKMWLDPIPPHIYVDELSEKYAETKEQQFVLNPIVGEYDDPAHQSQGVLRVPITRDGNTIIYGSAGNGKEMFIEAMCYSLLNEHSPQEVNLYILDFGAETLTAFSKAPHVGDVVLSRDTEKIGNLFKMLGEKLEMRRNLLAEYGGDLLQYNKNETQAESSIVIVINNFAIFSEMYGDLAGDIGYLTSEGTKYGIYFVLTCTGINNVRYSLLQNFKNLYCLRLNNIDDYTSVIGRTGGLIPESFKGRGLLRQGKDSVFEFQVAAVTREETSFKFINTFSQKLSDEYKGIKAQGIPVLPEVVTEQFLISAIEKNNMRRVPIGVEKETLNIAFQDFSGICLVLSVNQEWKNFIDPLGSMIDGQYDIKVAIMAQGDPAESVLSTVEDCIQLICEIETPAQKPTVVIIHSLSALTAMFEQYKPNDEGDDDGRTFVNKLKSTMENAGTKSNIYFVVGESSGHLTSLTLDSWYKKFVNDSNCIWVGNGISNQYRLKLNKIPSDYRSELSENYGFVVKNSIATLVKFLQ